MLVKWLEAHDNKFIRRQITWQVRHRKVLPFIELASTSPQIEDSEESSLL